MEANEAPAKLYLSKNIYSTFVYQTPDPEDETQVEYIRRDSVNSMLEMSLYPSKKDIKREILIDKVCEWLKNHNNYQRVHDNGGGVRFDMTQCVFDLRKAMIGK